MPFDGFLNATPDLDSGEKRRLETFAQIKKSACFFHQQVHTASKENARLYGAPAPEKTKGLYVQADPIGLVGGLAPYGYAGQNPTQWIDPEGLTYLSNLNFLVEFLMGYGPRSRIYWQNAVETQEMMKGAGAARLRDKFYKSGCRNFNNGVYDTPDAHKEAGDDASQTPFQVGGFAQAVAVNKGDGKVTYIIWNVAGRRSLMGGPPYTNRSSPTGPLSNIEQYFVWTEPIDTNKCAKGKCE